MAKVWHKSQWYFDVPWGAWHLTEPGEFEESVAPPTLLRLEAEHVHMLIKALDEAGWIVPRLDVRLREEDLKITHRLLDLLEERKHADS
jgi:hypothetical protein